MISFSEIRRDGSDIRVHGNGFLQVDLPGDKRLHLFGHPEIKGQKYPSFVHDHSFLMESEVLHGRLVNVDYRTANNRWCEPTHAVYEAQKKKW